MVSTNCILNAVVCGMRTLCYVSMDELWLPVCVRCVHGRL